MAGRLYLGQAIKFPYEVDKFGRIALQSDSDLIKQSLGILFQEPVGSQLMREHYGSQIRIAMFEPNDVVLRSLLDHFILDAVSKWERRIMLYDILYDQPGNQPNLIRCTLKYIIKQSSEIDSYIFPYYRELKN